MKHLKILSLWIAQVLVVLLNLGVQLFLARLFTQEDVGTYYAIIALLNITATIGQFGLSKYLLIIFSKYKNISEDSKSNIVILFIIFNLIGILTYFLISYQFFKDNIVFALFLAPLFFSNNLIGIYTTMIQVNSKYITISVLRVVVPFSKVIAILVSGLIFQSDIIVLGTVISIISLVFSIYLILEINNSINFFLDNKIIPSNDSKILENKKQLLIVLLPYALLNLTYMIYTQGNTFILGLLDNKVSVALFANAYMILNSIYIFPTIIYQKVLAHKLLAYIYRPDGKNIKEIIRQMQLTMISLSLILLIILYFLADYIIITLFGKEYTDAILLFKILLIGVPYRLISISLGTIMSSDFFVRKRVKIEITVTLLNIILNYFLIQYIGIMGVVITVIITEFLLAFLFTLYVKRYFNIKLLRVIANLTIILSFLYIVFDFNTFSIVIVSIGSAFLSFYSGKKLLELM
ncbi:oligosaccharide flippase family protein [Salinicoccus roseus]|uniref:Oligosaccharide flippase family protein n=1 Tax=Salinicoccus roseus TaxID=45670 RepID=A0A0C2HIE3_9STAP|nr:oligosaccharide flippase family protein [Salinicoccus roseus]KIH71424.1 hypothetical protein SN16_01695 [Salinicoccus roseus]MDB0579484.1 oligosaccharide flippase family protein [Salinicoccus roseus]